MTWNIFPRPEAAYVYTAASLKKAWPKLHIADAEPLPKDAALLQAWIAFHAGDFEKAVKLGLELGIDGYTVANKATCIYATYLERDTRKQVALFDDVIKRCEELQIQQPDNHAAYYWHAYALGRYAQGISIVKALAQGLAKKVRQSLDATIERAPKHADALVALGAFHAEIIHAVGTMIGSMSYGAKKEESFKCFKAALAINPSSAIARIEQANALIKLDGKKKKDEATALYEQAAACEPHDAMERMDVDLAKHLLGEE